MIDNKTSLKCLFVRSSFYSVVVIATVVVSRCVLCSFVTVLWCEFGSFERRPPLYIRLFTEASRRIRVGGASFGAAPFMALQSGEDGRTTDVTTSRSDWSPPLFPATRAAGGVTTRLRRLPTMLRHLSIKLRSARLRAYSVHVDSIGMPPIEGRLTSSEIPRL